MMGKMGLGLLGFVGKSLLSGGGAAGSVLSAVGKKCAGGAGKGGGGSSVLSLLGGKSGGGLGCGGGRGGQGGKGRGRNQNAAPLEEAFAALLDKDRAATGARLETASRPELAPFTPSADQISDVRAEEASVAGEGPLDARREAALEALMRHIASFTDGACVCGTKPSRNRPFMRPCAKPWSKRGSLLRWNSRRPPARYFCAMTPDV